MSRGATLLLVLVIAIAVACALLRRRVQTHRLALVQDELGNEALVVAGALAGAHRALFLVDTAYAGAPVVSTSYLAVQHQCAWGSVEGRYRRCLGLMQREVREDDRHAAVARFLREGRCRAFTSGCTLRLMGVGETTEAQADMLLCPSIDLGGEKKTRDVVDADVMVTNALRGSVHILTCDYLLHRAPCVLRPAAGIVHFGLRPLDAMAMQQTFVFFPAHFVGGAFVVPMDVGGGVLRVVVDTGAAAALTVSAAALAKLSRCRRSDPPRKATQSGVHGERVCSDVLTANVKLGSIDLGDVEVFAAATDVEGADAYCGMGCLRALDLWLESTRIGFRRSGLLPRGSYATAPGDCGKSLPACAAL